MHCGEGSGGGCFKSTLPGKVRYDGREVGFFSVSHTCGDRKASKFKPTMKTNAAMINNIMGAFCSHNFIGAGGVLV